MFYTKQLLHLHIFSVILIVFFHIFKEIILRLIYMFVRTMLAVSLGCIFAGTVFAASTAEQPLNPQMATDVSVQDPIDPLALESSAAQAPATRQTTNAPTEKAQITTQEKKELDQASAALTTLQNTEDQNADSGVAPAAASKTASSAATKASWTLEGLNNATWYENIGAGRSEEHTSELQSRENLVCRLLLE